MALFLVVVSQQRVDDGDQRQRPTQEDLLRRKILRCAFSCAAQQNLMPFFEAYPTCKQDLSCYQEPFNMALKTFKPCFQECMSADNRRRNQ